MPSHRFYVADLAANVVHLDRDESHHARRVMRVEVGDGVELFDGAGTEADAQVVALKPDLALEITRRQQTPRPRPHITLAVALPKGDRAAMLVEKACELGADVFVPLRTQRSVVDPREGKVERLQRIALEAAKQCGRAWLMTVEPPTDFSQVLKQPDFDIKLIADTSPDSGQPLQNSNIIENVGMSSQPPCARLLLLIGPEGGWTDEERKAAAHAGFRPWTFNPNTLRIETAALAALAILRQTA